MMKIGSLQIAYHFLRSFAGLAFLLCLAQQSGAQRVLYVDQDAIGFNNGTNWKDAFTDLKTAISAATAGDHLWLTEGTYTIPSFGNRFESFVIDKDLQILGGFIGNEINPDQRNREKRSALSAEINTALHEDNAYHILRIESGAELSFDGIEFRDAYGDFDGEENFRANGVGAILISNPNNEQADFHFYHCDFVNNYASRKGAGVYATDADSSSTRISFEHCFFDGNYAKGDGSVAFIELFSKKAIVKFEDCLMENKSLQDNGNSQMHILLRGEQNELQIENCHFKNNIMLSADPLLAVALYGKTDFNLLNTDFTGNKVGQLIFTLISNSSGGNIRFEHLYIADNHTFSSPLQMLNSSFAEDQPIVTMDHIEITRNVNTDTWILIDLQEIKLNSFDYNTFTFNKGGPLFLNPIKQDFVVNNCLVAGNEFREVDFSNQFVIKNFDNHKITFNNSTFANNVGTQGSILRTFFNREDIPPGEIIFNNCIFYDNEDFFENGSHREQIVSTTNNHIKFNHCLFNASNCDEVSNIDGIGTTICNDACLFDSNPRFKAGSDFRLAFCSPAIDAGDDKKAQFIEWDLDLEPRIFGKQVDLGSFEAKEFNRYIGFDCQNGIIYSDWVSGVQDLTFQQLDLSPANISKRQVGYVLQSEDGCTDTVFFDTQELAGLDFIIPNEKISLPYAQELAIPFTMFTADSITFHSTPNILSSVDIEGNQLYLRPTETGMHYLAGVNKVGCYSLDSIYIEIEDFQDIAFIPNAFTPNDDGVHDFLNIVPQGGEQLMLHSFTVFDRYGNQVHYMANQLIEEEQLLWDGRKEGNRIAKGVYVYIAEVEVNGQRVIMSGNISVL